MWMAGVIDDWACRAVRYPRHQTPHSSLSTVDCRLSLGSDLGSSAAGSLRRLCVGENRPDGDPGAAQVTRHAVKCVHLTRVKHGRQGSASTK